MLRWFEWEMEDKNKNKPHSETKSDVRFRLGKGHRQTHYQAAANVYPSSLSVTHPTNVPP